MEDWQCFFYDYFISIQFTETVSKYLNMLSLMVILAVVIYITYFIARKILVNAFIRFSNKSKTNFDELLVYHKASKYIEHIISLTITIKLFPIFFSHLPN